MGLDAKHNLVSRLKSERGASFSAAMLLLIVCVVLSSVILAASTVSAGWMANRGQVDQRYYSVVSASQLFQDSLGADESATYQFVLEREGTRSERTGAAPTDWTVKVSSGPVVPSDAPDFDFLTNLTWYALIGVQPAQIEINPVLSGTDWPIPVASRNEKGYFPVEYTVAPQFEGDNASKDDLAVTVKGRLWSDWTLELEFCNEAGVSDPNYFHLYMVLEGDFEESTDTSETLVTSSDSTGAAQYKVTETRTTTITWHLKQIVPGRGLDASA